MLIQSPFGLQMYIYISYDHLLPHSSSDYLMLYKSVTLLNQSMYAVLIQLDLALINV